MTFVNGRDGDICTSPVEQVARLEQLSLPQPGKVREGAGVDVIAGTIARRAVGRLGGSDRGLDDTGDVDRDLSRSSTTSSSEPFKATIASAMAWLLYRAPIQLLIRRLARA